MYRRNRSIIVLLLALVAVAFLLAWQIRDSSAAQAFPDPAGGTQTPFGKAGNWQMIFSEDFESQALDTNKWVTCYWWDEQGCTNEGNQNLNWYRAENVTLQDGVLRLTAREEQVQASDGRTYEYTSGMVTTGRNVDDITVPPKFGFQYGYLEVRAKVPKGQGLWPAIWLLPADHISKPEIDVMEVLGHRTDTVYMNFHYLDENGNRARSKGEWIGEDISGDWHTFAVNWQKDRITWYIDGIERRTFSDQSQIPSEPMYLLLNLAVGGDWPGSPNENTSFPVGFEVDYVRIWKQSGDITLYPVADTYTDASEPEQNFGEESVLAVDGEPQQVAYMKYDLQSITRDDIAAVYLRVHTTGVGMSGSENSQAVYLVLEDWEENRLTYQDHLPLGTDIIGLINKTGSNIAYDIPLERSVIQEYAGRTLSLALVATGHDGLDIYSRDFRPLAPQLIIQTSREQSNIWQRLAQTAFSAAYPF